MVIDKKPKMALIVAKPGPLRNSLFSLMTTLPQINLVAESQDLASISRLGSQIQPDLVIMELDLPKNHLQETVHSIKNEWITSRIIVLVDDVHMQQEAELAGADVVLFKGIRAATLMKTVEELLSSDPPAVSETLPVDACLLN